MFTEYCRKSNWILAVDIDQSFERQGTIKLVVWIYFL